MKISRQLILVVSVLGMTFLGALVFSSQSYAAEKPPKGCKATIYQPAVPDILQFYGVGKTLVKAREQAFDRLSSHIGVVEVRSLLQREQIQRNDDYSDEAKLYTSAEVHEVLPAALAHYEEVYCKKGAGVFIAYDARSLYQRLVETFGELNTNVPYLSKDIFTYTPKQSDREAITLDVNNDGRWVLFRGKRKLTLSMTDGLALLAWPQSLPQLALVTKGVNTHAHRQWEVTFAKTQVAAPKQVVICSYLGQCQVLGADIQSAQFRFASPQQPSRENPWFVFAVAQNEWLLVDDIGRFAKDVEQHLVGTMYRPHTDVLHRLLEKSVQGKLVQGTLVTQF